MRNYTMTLGRKIIFTFTIGLFGCTNQTIQIKLIPGVGIIIHDDTLALGKSSPNDLTRLTHIKDTFNFGYVQWDGFDSLGNSTYGSYVKKNIPFDGLTFEFNGPKEDSLSLKAIYVDLKNPNHQIFLAEKNISDTSISVINKFPNSLRKDISTENSSEHGITFVLDTARTPNKIEKISIHGK